MREDMCVVVCVRANGKAASAVLVTTAMRTVLVLCCLAKTKPTHRCAALLF